MKIDPRQYPYPVLSYFSDDFVTGKFKIKVKIDYKKENEIKFKAECKLTNQELKKLVEEQGKAQYALHFECPSTRFRKLITFNSQSFSFNISSDMLNDKVEVCPVILSTDVISDYQNKGFHSDYSGVSFKVKKGDILAVDEEIIINFEKNIDSLKEVPSIFSVQPNESNDAPPFDIEALSNDKLIIKLSEDNFKNYKMLKQNQNLHTTLASMLILPTLISLLERIKNEIETGTFDFDLYSDYRWFRVLNDRLKEIGIDINEPNCFVDSSIVIAQKIIGNPVSSSLKLLEEYQYEG